MHQPQGWTMNLARRTGHPWANTARSPKLEKLESRFYITTELEDAALGPTVLTNRERAPRPSYSICPGMQPGTQILVLYNETIQAQSGARESIEAVCLIQTQSEPIWIEWNYTAHVRYVILTTYSGMCIGWSCQASAGVMKRSTGRGTKRQWPILRHYPTTAWQDWKTLLS
jgi:hypothetical protein